jgi:hypothetical protein
MHAKLWLDMRCGSVELSEQHEVGSSESIPVNAIKYGSVIWLLSMFNDTRICRNQLVNNVVLTRFNISSSVTVASRIALILLIKP